MRAIKSSWRYASTLLASLHALLFVVWPVR